MKFDLAAAKPRRYLRHFFRTYIPFLLFPLLVGSFIYVRTASVIEREVVSRNEDVLRRTRQYVDMVYQDISDVAYRIGFNNRIMKILELSKTIGGPDIYAVRAAQRELTRYFFSDESLQDVFVWFADQELVLSLNTTYLHAEKSFDPFFRFDDMDYAEWRDTLVSRRHNQSFMPEGVVSTEEQQYRIIPFVQSIPVNSPAENSGAIVALIDVTIIQRQLTSCIESYGGLSYAVDREGTPITSVSSEWDYDITPARLSDMSGSMEQKIGPHVMVTSVEVSPHTGLQFVTMVPKAALLRHVVYVRNMMLIAALVLLAVGSGLAVFFARRSSLPVRRLAAAIESSDGTRGFSQILDDAQTRISTLTMRNSLLRDSVESYMPHVRHSFLTALLTGNLDGQQDFGPLVTASDLGIDGRQHCVLLVRFPREDLRPAAESISQRNVQKLLVRELIGTLDEEVTTHDMEPDSLAIIVTGRSQNISALKKRVERLVRNLRREAHKRFRLPLICSAGQIREGIDDLHASYFEAKSVSEGRFVNMDESDLAWFDPAYHTGGYQYYYPLSEEQRIINAVKGADFGGLQTILRAIKSRNLTDREEQSGVPNVLFFEMKATLIKCAREIGFDVQQLLRDVDRRFENNLTYRDAMQTFDELERCYQTLCSFADLGKKSHKRRIADAMMEHLDANYTDKQLSLTSVSLRFRMSEAYCSHFFKEQNGENFHTYLERVRLRAATEMLLQGNTVTRAADQVGYSSTNTFRRAYKRFFGVSPSKVKEDRVRPIAV